MLDNFLIDRAGVQIVQKFGERLLVRMIGFEGNQHIMDTEINRLDPILHRDRSFIVFQIRKLTGDHQIEIIA
ncbi:hypothetical protein D3C81_2193000 [compost metagenome]